VPIYEFACRDCGTEFTQFLRSVSASSSGSCGACGSTRVERLISKVSVLKGDRGRAEALDTGRIMSGLEGSDVGSFARWARNAGREYDAELGTNFAELADKADAGEDPVERIDTAYTVNYHVEKRRSEVLGGEPDSPVATDND
jgi:putative FmdB family regulatory protein